MSEKTWTGKQVEEIIRSGFARLVKVVNALEPHEVEDMTKEELAQFDSYRDALTDVTSVVGNVEQEVLRKFTSQQGGGPG